DLGREQPRLVVSAVADALAVKDRRHDDVQRDPSREIPRDAAGDERSELGRERALAAVLEAMDRSRDRAAIDRRGVQAAATDRIARLTAREAEPGASGVAAGAAWGEEGLGARGPPAGSD